jgi:hypothetical protein
MALLKKFIMAFFISTAMLVAATPSAIAMEKSGTDATLDDVIKSAEATLVAMKEGAEKTEVGMLLKETKQLSKSVVISGPADIPRTKANAKIKKSRKAYRAGDTEKAIKLAEEALDLYKAARTKHFN